MNFDEIENASMKNETLFDSLEKVKQFKILTISTKKKHPNRDKAALASFL